jgi:hypothetical protein
MAADIHGYFLGYTSANHIANASAPQIVEESAYTSNSTRFHFFSHLTHVRFLRFPSGTTVPSQVGHTSLPTPAMQQAVCQALRMSLINSFES